MKKRDIFGDVEEKQNEASETEDFGQLFEQSMGGATVKFSKGERVKAEVLTVGKENIFVLVKGREGVLSRAEFKVDGREELPQPADVIELFIVRETESMLELTKKTSAKALGEDLEDAYDMELPVEGRVTEVVNGGFRVEVHHKLAFCPISQMDSKLISDPTSWIGRKETFLITKLEGGRNIVLSRRKLLDMEKATFEGAFIQTAKPGQLFNGRISRLEKFGAFVELEGGIEGLIHISELGWSRVAHPSEVVTVGELVSVKLLEISEDAAGRLRISLSRKQTDQDPWLTVEKEFPVGTSIQGQIRSHERFGFFIELKPGVVGLLPKSALKEVANEREMENKKSGERILVTIQNVNSLDKRISLSLPKEQEDGSWKEFSKDKKVDSGFGTLGDQFKVLLKK
jgi:small subunit ribosomal protein S1